MNREQYERMMKGRVSFQEKPLELADLARAYGWQESKDKPVSNESGKA